MNDLITVIVPAYNVAPWLPRCLDSILDQTYKNLQIIVIDDGSTDSTPQIIDEYSRKDERIVAIHQKNEGLIAVRNKGIKMAMGKYVTFVDGDDTIRNTMYEKLLDNAIEHDADISHCGVMFCFEDGHCEAHYGTNKVIIQNQFEGLKDLLEGKFIEPGLWNKLYKLSLLKESCLDNDILNNEDLLRNFVVFSRAQKSVYEDFCGYLYYQREGSMSKDKKRIVKANRQIVKARRIIVEHSSKEIFPYAMQSWLSSLINSIHALEWSNDVEAKQYCRECRSKLIKEKENFHFLIKRQQVAAWLIVFSPVLHKIVYCIYKVRYR